MKSTLAGAATLAIPQIGRTEAQKTLTFVPHADLASLDPVWTTADVTRNFALAVYDTLTATTRHSTLSRKWSKATSRK